MVKLFRQLAAYKDFGINTLWVEADDVDYITPGMRAVRKFTNGEATTNGVKPDVDHYLLPVRLLKPI